jgi:hypothetical protein
MQRDGAKGRRRGACILGPQLHFLGHQIHRCGAVWELGFGVTKLKFYREYVCQSSEFRLDLL